MKESVKLVNDIIANIEKVIVGKRSTIELIIIALLCDSHVLIEDVPGVGKTALASAMAKSIKATFNRVQFTPDVLPSDITGFAMYNQKTNEFEYHSGAIMCQLMLADEINRTSPKTQASLLEAMEENQVSVDGVTYPLPKPFMVLATQNPIEYSGTYPLPEAQMDRFLMRVSIGYPSAEEESKIISTRKTQNPLETLQAVATTEEIVQLQKNVRDVFVEESLNEYVVGVVRATRNNEYVALGASPRASLALYRAAQAHALYSGRDYVIPDDVKKMAYPVLSHRISLKADAKLKKITTVDVVSGILNTLKVKVDKAKA